MYMLLLIMDLFLVLLLILCLYAVIKPEVIIKFTLRKSMDQMKFYAFDAQITPTPKSTNVIRLGHLLVAIVIVIFLVVLNYVLFGG